MKTTRFLIIPILALGAFTISAEAQRNRTPVRRPTTTANKSTTTAKPPVTSAAILAKNQVSTQLFNVNKFVDVLGPIAIEIEAADNETRTAKKPTKAAQDANTANKQKLIQSIRILKGALSTLETDFRTKIDLKKYLPTIQGITDLCAQSEDNAIAGKFVAAKEPLRAISKKLSDTLALMP